jgi:amino acid transporter
MSDTLKITLYVALGVLAVGYFVYARENSEDGVQEPPLVSPIIPLPFIGHLLGLLWYRSTYYTDIRYVLESTPKVSVSARLTSHSLA